MGLFELVFVAIGLSMDAFAVSVCKGLSIKVLKKKHYIITGLWLGGSQAVMPLLGYFMGRYFERFIKPVDHWIVFILLIIIGGNMIKESTSQEDDANDSFSFITMFILSIATSIDDLAIGICIGLIPRFNIFLSALMLGIVAFGVSALGLKVGNKVGSKHETKAEFIGGIIIILIGIKILLEHLGIIGF